jgi:hypothetical protein
MMRAAPFALCALLVWGCAAHDPIDGRQAAVRGGSEAPEDENVVAVVNFAGGQCSGSLIAPRLVLTARHCVAETEGEELQVVCGQTPFEAPDSPGAIFVVPRPTITDDENDYAAVTAIRMPEGVADDLCGSDVVLLVLEKPLTAIAPLVPRLGRAVEPGESYSAVGYGVDEAIEGQPSGVRKRLDGLEVSCSGAECGLRDVRDNEWVGSGGPCSGDSGGPALDQAGELIGVVSRGTTGCGEPVFGDIATRRGWLVAEAIALANTAGEVPPSWAPCDDDNPCPAATPAEPTGPDATCALAARRLSVARACPWALAVLAFMARARSTRKRAPGPSEYPRSIRDRAAT